jgi:hypothetical protein
MKKISEEAKKRAANYMSLKGALEPKQETLEEAALKSYPDDWDRREKLAFIEGANWQAEQSQEAINKLISIIEWYDDESDVRPDAETFMWFEQFKKK